MQGNVLNWLGIVVDSVKGGSKNGSSLPVLRGTMSGKIINWLGVVGILYRTEKWRFSMAKLKHQLVRWVSLMDMILPDMLAQIYCRLSMQHSGVPKPSIPQQVAEDMVARPRREQRSSTPLGNALVAAGYTAVWGSTYVECAPAIHLPSLLVAWADADKLYLSWCLFCPVLPPDCFYPAVGLDHSLCRVCMPGNPAGGSPLRC